MQSMYTKQINSNDLMCNSDAIVHEFNILYNILYYDINTLIATVPFSSYEE